MQLPTRTLPLVALALLAGLAPAQGEGRPDQVLWRSRRGLSTDTGVVIENNLSRTVIRDANGKEIVRDASEVERVTFMDVPLSFRDAEGYELRGDYENAAAKFRHAAGDPAARDVVQARARLLAAEALMKWGATNSAAFGEARDEASSFLSEHPESRDVPRARAIKARATRLAGDAAAAAEAYRSLYREAAGEAPTPGYPAQLCYRSGVYAAECLIEAGDVPGARELYAELEASLPRALAEVSEGDPLRDDLLAIQSDVRMGEGHCLLAEASVKQAQTFFEGQLRAAEAADEGNAALRFAARLGLAQALFAGGETRKAQIEFALVSAIDHTDRDRVARALVGLADCAMKLSDADAKNAARIWLQTVRERYADTPSVRRAQELAESL